MAQKRHTQMGGSTPQFPATCWTQIVSAREGSTQQRHALTATVLQRYWKPVYAALRRKGLPNEDAKDLTQGFFCEIVLGNDLISQADRDRGKFRTLLLTSLDRYVISQHRKATAKKRAPAEGLVSLEGAAEAEGPLPIPDEQASPDEAFAYAWAAELLDEVIVEVRQGLIEDGKELFWKVFRARVLGPILDGSAGPNLGELARSLGIESQRKASNMIVTVRRRFQSALRRRVREYVDSDEQVDLEIAELIETLSASRRR